jgi:hypothetical protein
MGLLIPRSVVGRKYYVLCFIDVQLAARVRGTALDNEEDIWQHRTSRGPAKFLRILSMSDRADYQVLFRLHRN